VTPPRLELSRDAPASRVRLGVKYGRLDGFPVAVAQVALLPVGQPVPRVE